MLLLPFFFDDDDLLDARLEGREFLPIPPISSSTNGEGISSRVVTVVKITELLDAENF